MFRVHRRQVFKHLEPIQVTSCAVFLTIMATSSTTAASTSTSNNVYISHEYYGWIPARLVSSNAKTATVLATLPTEPKPTTEEITVNLSDYDQYSSSLPLQNVDQNGELLEVANMVDLNFLHEAAILYNLKARHCRGVPYTRTGDIVIAVNPYQVRTELYNSRTVKCSTI